jgi:hypothetical protein
MIAESDHDYHTRRARAELDLAYRSECRSAMESHLRLSSLHMRRLASLETVARLAGLRSPLRHPAGYRSVRCGVGREAEAVSG